MKLQPHLKIQTKFVTQKSTEPDCDSEQVSLDLESSVKCETSWHISISKHFVYCSLYRRRFFFQNLAYHHNNRFSLENEVVIFFHRTSSYAYFYLLTAHAPVEHTAHGLEGFRL